MSHFYGTLQGSRGAATRGGTRNSGFRAVAASWRGAVETRLYVDDAGRDCYIVEQVPWQGTGVRVELARGVIGEPGFEAGPGDYLRS